MIPYRTALLAALAAMRMAEANRQEPIEAGVKALEEALTKGIKQ